MRININIMALEANPIRIQPTEEVSMSVDPIAVAGLAVGLTAAIFGLCRLVIQVRQRREALSAEEFRDVRKCIKKDRKALYAKVAGSPLPASSKLQYDAGLRLLVRPGWIPSIPIPLGEVKLTMADASKPESRPEKCYLPYRQGKQYSLYSDAIEALDRPTKFDDREQYRLLTVSERCLTFSTKRSSYFDKVNYGEYLALQAYQMRCSRSRDHAFRRRRDLLRRIGQPADYIVLAGIDTVILLVNAQETRIIMHLRGQHTGTSMGTFHVIPAGEFQPSCMAVTSFADDFDLWKSMIREFAEELLGLEEYDGSQTVTFDYEAEPFRSINAELDKGNIRGFYLGTGLDPLTFQAEILTAVVFKEETFNHLFGPVRTENSEGKIITDASRWGKPFTKSEYESYKSGEANTLPAGEAALTLAWRNRDVFQSCFSISEEP